MNKCEVLKTESYWHTADGTMIEEFEIVPKGEGHRICFIDAIIIQHGRTERLSPSTKMNLDGQGGVEGYDFLLTSATRLTVFKEHFTPSVKKL